MAGLMTDAALRRAMQLAAQGGSSRTLVDPGHRGNGRLVAMVRPMPKGALVEFYARQIQAGRRRMAKLGTYPAMSLAQARQAFGGMTTAIRDGENVRDVTTRARRERHGFGTLLQLCEGYAASLDAADRRSAPEVRRVLIRWHGGACAVIGGDRPACEVTPADIATWLRPFHQRTPSGAKQARAWLSAAYTWGLKREHDYTIEQPHAWGLKTNPAILVSADNAAQRGGTRHLDAAEFKAVWSWLASDAGRSDTRACNALRVIMATGQRVEEIAGLRGDQLGADGWLRWPKTKTGPAHSIPLPRQAAAIFAGMVPNRHGLWFPGCKRPELPFESRTLNWICKRAADQLGIPRFSPRDLRRTWRSRAGDGGLNAEECARIMNHAYGSRVEAIHYDRGENAAIKLAGVAKWEAVLAGLLETKNPA